MAVELFDSEVSLASMRPGPIVATLRFNAIPECLSDNSKNEWIFDLAAEDDSDFMRPLVFDTHFTGFTSLQRTDDDGCEVDLIAVSGLGGHAFGSFNERQGNFMWLRDGLPSDIPVARVLIYGYDSQLVQSSSFQNLSDLGRALRVDLRAIRPSSRSRPIVFLGHSLGGLVIKETIVGLKEEASRANTAMLDSIIGFMFFGVPHQGLAIESLVPLVQNYPNRSLLESLNKNSALLHRLDKEFNNAIHGRSPSIVSFYETEKSPTAVKNANGKWELSGPSRVLVDVSSATCGSRYHHPIDRDHSGMVKYSNAYDVLYRRVIIALQDLLGSAQSTLNVKAPTAGVYLPVPLSDESKDCLRSLSFREQEHRYSEIYTAKDTCEWLLWDPQYRGWVNGNRGLLWIKGNPGAGKFGSHSENRWDWTERELQEFLSEILTRGTKNQPVVIFVDALDEAGQSHAKSLLAYFKTLMDDIEREEAMVKICFSSRHYPILGHETIPKIFVEERNEEDIKLVVKGRLREIQPATKRQHFENEILMKAHGGFQWAILVVTILLDEHNIGTRTERLNQKLAAVPEALDELYGNILSGANEHMQQEMRKLFRWVLFTERPLSSQELREALVADKDLDFTTISESRQRGYWADTTPEFEKQVLHVSRGLLEFQTRDLWEKYDVDGEDWDREAQFIHQSAADYVLEMFMKPNGDVQEGDQLSRGKLSTTFPLLPYAVQFLFHHVREAEQAGSPQLDLLDIIQWSRQSEVLTKISSLWSVMDPDNSRAPRGWPFIGASTLHVIIGFGLVQLVFYAIHHRDKKLLATLLEKDVDLDGAVFFATQESSRSDDSKLLEIVSVLLEAGGNTKKSEHSDRRFHDDDSDEDEDYEGSYEFEAMVLASRRGNMNVVARMLEHDAPSDVRDTDGNFPLLVAIQNGYVEIAELLLRHDSQTAGMYNDDGRAPFDVAVDAGLFELALRLLQEGKPVAASAHHVYAAISSEDVDINTTDNDGNSPLMLAVTHKHEAIVNLLLSTNKVDVHLFKTDIRRSFKLLCLRVSMQGINLTIQYWITIRAGCPWQIRSGPGGRDQNFCIY
ncbi:hypothetical protein LX36DRAFT_703444, partial [Colletotrichum falcatum]